MPDLHDLRLDDGVLMSWLCLWWPCRWRYLCDAVDGTCLDEVGLYQCTRCKTMSIGSARSNQLR